MISINDGQCGKCAYFGSDQGSSPKLVQIRVSGQADAEDVESCGHPENARLGLRVAPNSGCSGYEPA